MKNIYLYALLFCALFSLAGSSNAGGQVYHDWSGTIGDIVYNQGGTHIIILDENIKITGTITVSNSTTLRILNTSPYELTISNGISGDRAAPMFRVIGGAKLSFNYNDLDAEDRVEGFDGTRYRRIILDGGAAFTEMDRMTDVDGVWRMSATASPKFNVSAIQSIGAIEVYNTTIRNFYFPEYSGTSHGVFGLATPRLGTALGKTGAVNTYRYTTLKNCLIEKCKGVVGTVIMVGSGVDEEGAAYLKAGIDPANSDRYITLTDVTVRDCVTFGDGSGWGGLIRCRGGSPHCLRLINSTFTGNFSHGDGGVLWWNACGHSNTKCTIDGCQFTDNRAMREAGAIRMEGSLEFTGSKTIISGNECMGLQRNKTVTPNTYTPDTVHEGNGGGIQIFGYAGNAGLVAGTLSYELPTCLEVTDNHAAGYGGGIAFDFTEEIELASGTNFYADFNGVNVHDNSAGKGGGGMYFSNTTDPADNYTFNLNLNKGSIHNNSAPSGGGIYVSSIDIGTDQGSLVEISDNTASSGSGGGIYLDDGTITLNNVQISNNRSLKSGDTGIRGGGGLFVSSGSFIISGGSISGNESDLYGGGVFVYNDSEARESITLTNGSILSNASLYGGGIAAYGALDLQINDIILESNTAADGGGVFAHGIKRGSGTILTYNSGIIRYNRAQNHETIIPETAYDLSYKDYSGIGGGIYMGQFTHLKISDPADFGIYSNVGDNGADDIFGYNRNVYIELPDVKNLNLSGYDDVQTHDLFWAEDYITNDINYDKGTKMKGAAWDLDKTNQRYRDVAENGMPGNKYLIDFNGKTVIHYLIDDDGGSTYLSLTIGWNQSTLTLVKHGMNDGDNVIFKIYSLNGGVETEYAAVVLSDLDKQPDGSRTKKVKLPADGVWKVTETLWSIGYTPDNESLTRTLTVNSTEEERTFVFTNTVSADAPYYREAIKVNRMTNE